MLRLRLGQDVPIVDECYGTHGNEALRLFKHYGTMSPHGLTCPQCDGKHEHDWVIVTIHHNATWSEDTVRCRVCGGRACQHIGDGNPCQLRRHHSMPHLYADGTTEPVGGN